MGLGQRPVHFAIRSALAVLGLSLASCSSTPPYQGYSRQQLDQAAPTCHNGRCSYHLALGYSRTGDERTALAYLNLSARYGYQPARTTLIKLGLPIPPADLDTPVGFVLPSTAYQPQPISPLITGR